MVENMEENYKLEKEYKVPAKLFSEAYLEYQKKFVYPKSRIFMILFAAIAVIIFIFGAAVLNNAADNKKYFTYLAFMIACALAMREWYNPRKRRRNYTESVRALGEPVYKIGIADKFVDISTVSDDLSNLSGDEEEDILEEDPLPEKTRLDINSSFHLLEYDRFFLLMPGKEMLYILPKEGFSEEDLKTVRDIKK
ncbi:YcxB family protein [Ruminococcus sp.]|uniref:YcxB family protein n=1 Tax=Ruminococcus sp. TaxID=41978 RepID=UPI0025DBB1FF|nr:YcxB family protein [Ruminococcus sp.]